MIDVQEIRAEALRKNACGKIAEIRDTPELIRLFYSPQGIEFAAKTGFPDLALLRANKEELALYGILADAGEIELPSREYLCIAGDTRAVIHASQNEFVHNILVMHGAEALIKASGYAVVSATEIAAGGLCVENDGTAVVL